MTWVLTFGGESEDPAEAELLAQRARAIARELNGEFGISRGSLYVYSHTDSKSLTDIDLHTEVQEGEGAHGTEEEEVGVPRPGERPAEGEGTTAGA